MSPLVTRQNILWEMSMVADRSGNGFQYFPQILKLTRGFEFMYENTQLNYVHNWSQADMSKLL
jgi:hypothetical protein